MVAEASGGIALGAVRGVNVSLVAVESHPGSIVEAPSGSRLMHAMAVSGVTCRS